MIIVGAYPNTFPPSSEADKPLRVLCEFLSEFLPPEVALHLLPFAPQCGDGGFSLRSWADVRDELGSWADIADIARERHLIVDVVYNHVGIEHSFFRSFLDNPYRYAHLFYAFQTDDEMESPETPRGGRALRNWEIHGKRWLLWQTFCGSAVDIQIDDPLIIEAIRSHLQLLRSNGIRSVRVDAPAYFGKVLAGPIRHNPESYRLARLVGETIHQCGLGMFAQLDCDPPAQLYFGPEVPIVDFSFSAHLALAILTQRPNHLCEHLKKTWCIPNILIRAPRTHDGILMKSTFFSTEARDLLVESAVEHGITPRMINGFPYELNASLPYLYGQSETVETRHKRLQLAIVVSAFVPGISYIYLPFLVDFQPELLKQPYSDPRSLNRLGLPHSHMDEFLHSSFCQQQTTLLRQLLALALAPGCAEERAEDRIHVIEKSGLFMTRRDLGLAMVANFSTVESLDTHHLSVLPLIPNGDIIHHGLGPLEYRIWSFRKIHDRISA